MPKKNSTNKDKIKKKENTAIKTKKKKEPIKQTTELSHKHIMFCEEYIKTQNATQSYLKVYPNVKETTAGTNGNGLLKNTLVKNYIDERLRKVEKKAIADADEILEFFTKIVRADESIKDQLGLEISVKDRISAGKELGKRYGLFRDPEEGEKETPKTPIINFNIVDNSELEKELYKDMN